jgi:D-arginine dehydrogenase
VAAAREGSGWRLTLADGREVRAEILVNAAGAWADPLAQIAGIAPLGIAPLRRTIAQLRVEPAVPADLPLVLDIAERFYFKPESGRLWLSPHDETPSDPCDAAPEELDVALAIERLGQVVDWSVEHVEHRWAGLRSFAPDRLPVIGFDPREPRFFWFAGQGGFGIQTAPAAARLGAGLLLGEQGGTIDPSAYLPERFEHRA